MSRLASGVVLCAVLLCLALDSSQKAKSEKARDFSFVGARDFARFFVPYPTPLVIDPTKELESSARDQGFFPSVFSNPFAPFIQDKPLESLSFAPSAMLIANAKAFDKELAARRSLLQAQAVLFQAMLADPSKRDDKELYLTLATLEYRLNGFYHFKTLVAYTHAYLHAGGDRAKLPSYLAVLPTLVEPSLMALAQILPILLQDKASALPTHLFLPLSFASGKRPSFIRTFTQGAQGCVGIFAQRSGGFMMCLPPFASEPLLLAFDERLYIIANDRIYLATTLAKSLPVYGTLVYEEKSRPRICSYSAELFDSKRQENLARDLARAGYGVDSSKRALKQWQEDIAGNDEQMLVEYLGYFDVFNDGQSVPLARTHTTIAQGLPFYEAFSLDSSTLQADIALSHPSMVISGRIPSLFLVRHKGQILGCVRDEAHREEKLFRFHRDSVPELVAHNRLERSLRTIRPLLAHTKSRPNHCYMERKSQPSDTRYGLLALGESIITESSLCDKAMQKTLAHCASLAGENELECRLKAINEAIENVL